MKQPVISSPNFAGDHCVGIAHPQYLNAYDAWYVMMTVYGDSTGSENLQFRLWNAESGITYSSVKVLPAGFPFSPNMVKGTLTNPIVLEVTSSIQQTLALQPAWNWISMNIKPLDAATEKVFEPVLGEITMVKSKTEFFTVNTPDTTYAGSLKTIDVTSSYRVQAQRAATLTIDGTAVNCAQTPVSIHNGWNWIGYLPLQTMSVSDALADIEPVAGDLIKSKTAFAVYDGAQWVGTLTRMTPGEGYMYQSHASEPFTFLYPGASVVKANGERLLANVRSTSDEGWAFVPVTDPYSGNMAIVARVMNGEEMVHGLEVGIFAGEECRGAATEEFINEEASGYWFITVAGDEPTPLTIKVHDRATQQITTLQQTLQYTDDASLGTLAEPYIIQLQAAEGIEDVQGNVQGIKVQKVFEDGILYILRNGEKYDASRHFRELEEKSPGFSCFYVYVTRRAPLWVPFQLLSQCDLCRLTLRMLRIVGSGADGPEVTLHGLFAVRRVFLREERCLVGRRVLEAVLTSSDCSCDSGEAYADSFTFLRR